MLVLWEDVVAELPRRTHYIGMLWFHLPIPVCVKRPCGHSRKWSSTSSSTWPRSEAALPLTICRSSLSACA